MKRIPLSIIVGIAVCAVYVFTSAVEADVVRLKLVAADREGMPLCSSFTDFTYHPAGGLIATQWVSGVRLNDEKIFVPSRPGDAQMQEISVDSLDDEGDGVIDGELDDLMAEIRDDEEDVAERVARPIDVVDAMYRGKKYYKEEITIGPTTERFSLQDRVELRKKNILTPGGLRFTYEDETLAEHAAIKKAEGAVAVLCYPVRITARQSVDGVTRRTAFDAKLSWQGYRLLADARFEHSAALPLGLPSEITTVRKGLPPFYDLTVYLPAGGAQAKPYEINGRSFTVAADGVKLHEETGEARLPGPFHIELQLPASESGSPARKIPLFTHLVPGTTLAAPTGLDIPDGGVAMLAGRGVVIPASFKSRVGITLPDRLAEYPNIALLCDNTTKLTVYVVAMTDTEKVKRSGQIGLLVNKWVESGPGKMPASLEIAMRPYPSFRDDHSGDRTLIVTVSGGEFSIPTRGIPAGAYELRLPGLIDDAADYQLLAVVAPSTARGSVSLSTHNSRCDYRQDEMIEVTAMLRAAEALGAQAVDVVLTPFGREARTVGKLTFDAVEKGALSSRVFSLAAAQLNPGRYTLSTRSGSGALLAHRMLFTVYPAEKTTLWEGFATEITEIGPLRTPEGICNYNTMLSSPAATLDEGEERERYLGQYVVDEQLQAMCERDPFWPAPEATRAYDKDERDMVAAMRFGVTHHPHGAAGWGQSGQTANWNPKHSLEEDLDWMRRVYAQRAQIFREFSNFGGFFMNWYPVMGEHYESHPRQAGRALLQGQALGKAVAAAQGPLPKPWTWTKADGLHYVNAKGEKVKDKDVVAGGTEHPAFYDPAFKEIRRWRKKGARRRARALALAYEAWTGTTRELGDWNYVSFVPTGWFRGYVYYPPLYFSTTPRAGIHAYTDWAEDPFMSIYGIDWTGAGSGKPAWVQVMSGDRSVQIRQTFLSAGRGAWGVGTGIGNAVPTERIGADARAICGLMNRYGPYFMTMKPDPDVAILRSFTQEATDRGAFAGSGGRNGMVWFAGLQGELWVLYYNLLRSGRPATFITEEQIAAGELKKYKALFLHRQRLLVDDDVMSEIKVYAEAGGMIFKDSTSAKQYPGQTVDLSADETVEARVHPSTHKIGQRHSWILYNYLRSKARVDKVVASIPKGRTGSSHYHIVHTDLAGKDTAAIFVINDTHLPADLPNQKWFIQNYINLTRRGKLYFDKPYCVYDVTEGGAEMQLSEPSQEREGTWEYPVSFLRAEGRILILTKKPIRDVTAKVDYLRRAGADQFVVKASVLDADGAAIADALPFELGLTDPAGQTIKQIYRALGPGKDAAILFGRDAQPGTWRVSATELVTGRRATIEIEIKGTAQVAIAQAGEGRVIARREHEIRRFLTGTRPLTILLDEGQSSAYEQPARGLAAAVRQAGRECEILRVTPDLVVDFPLRWRRNTYDAGIWAQIRSGDVIGRRRAFAANMNRDYTHYDFPRSGYEHPGARFAIYRDVIVLGSRHENRFIPDLHETINRLATDNSPGPGNALIQVTWDGYAPKYNALTIQSDDLAGTGRGCAYVASLLADPEPRPQPQVLAGFASRDMAQTTLPNIMRDVFGTRVGRIDLLDGGKQFWVGLNGLQMSGSSTYRLDAEGQVLSGADGITDSFGIRPAGPDDTYFVDDWRKSLIVMDGKSKPLWRMDAGHRWIEHSPSGDFIFYGEEFIARVGIDGRTQWIYDNRLHLTTREDFLRPWNLVARAVSEDGAFILAEGYSADYYLGKVSGYTRPGILLLDARTGKVRWKKMGIMPKDSVCLIRGSRVLAGNSGLAKKHPEPSLTVFDLRGKMLKRMPFVRPVIAAELLADGTSAVVQGGPSKGLSLLDLDTGATRAVPLEHRVKRFWGRGDKFLVSDWVGGLALYSSDLAPLWTSQINSPVYTATFMPNGRELVVGTDSGHVHWLDASGKVTRTTDLMPYNYTDDPSAWTRRWVGAETPKVPVRSISKEKKTVAAGFGLAAKYADFSANLLKNGDFDRGTAGWDVVGEAGIDEEGRRGVAALCTGKFAQAITSEERTTYVVNLYVRKPLGKGGDDDALRLDVTTGADKKLYTAVVPVGPSWQKRSISFRTADRAGPLTLAFVPEGEDTQVAIDDVSCTAVRFRSSNLLDMKAPEAGAIGEGGGLGALDRAVGKGDKTIDVSRYIQWMDHLGKALGAPKPKIMMPWTLMFDGAISGHESSWTGRPLYTALATHASMTVKLPRSKAIALVAVYEDSGATKNYTESFAILGRVKKSWQLLGYRTGNKSPYNLIAFEPREVDALQYLWTGSGDDHVRIMEMEAYLGEEDLEVDDLF